MCGLVGLAAKDSVLDTKALSKLMAEARIRGQHATGVSHIDDYGIHTKKLPVSQDKFPLDEELWRSNAVIGHLRYSTSDLEFNQPFATKNRTLIHNGVVTQEPPTQWEELFGVACEGRNDTEILLHLMNKGVHPLTLVNTSQACIVLEDEPEDQFMTFWRNEQRPLYYFEDKLMFVVASTKDIIRRALDVSTSRIVECQPCVSYTWNITARQLSQKLIREPLEDLQNAV